MTSDFFSPPFASSRTSANRWTGEQNLQRSDSGRANQVTGEQRGSSASSSNNNRFMRSVMEQPKKLAQINSEINKMTKDDIIVQLQELRLTTKGTKEVVKKRLKNHLRKHKAVQLSRDLAGKKDIQYDRHFDYLVVIDFECTCEDNVFDYAHEIIEFPAILIRTTDLQIVDEFQSYCRPKLHPELTEFCVKLTGIEQEQVTAARPFLDVLDDFRTWLASHNLGAPHRYAIVTDGPWDIAKFLQMQSLICGLDSVPHDIRYWINLRRAFSNTYKEEGKPAAGPGEWRNLAGMLSGLEMTFEGREHCGRDDAYNIARIVIRMLKDGCELRINERLLRRDRAEYMLKKRQQEHEKKRLRLVERFGDRAPPPREERERPPPEERTEEDRERAVWREHLPYKVVTVSRQEFLMDMYDECDTCSEADPDDNDEDWK